VRANIHSTLTGLFLGILNLGVYRIDKCLGGVNMREAQITLKNRKNYTESGDVGSQLGGGGLYPPRGGVQISISLDTDASNISVGVVFIAISKRR